MRIDDLEGKRVFILGGSTGIGAATARAFAAQGARVAIHYNRSAGPANALAAEIGGHALGGDLTETGAAASLVSRAIEVLGGLDILINNAGSLVARVPIADAENALIDDIFDLNARAVIQAFADNPGAGALKLGGKMIDQPHLKQAKALLARAEV